MAKSKNLQIKTSHIDRIKNKKLNIVINFQSHVLTIIHIVRRLAMRLNMKKMWRENKSFIIFIALMLVFRSAVADWNDVPTGSMKPTIVEGDRIYVDKLAYDINIPFVGYSVYKLNDPKTNDIIIFNSIKADKRLVKRVIGVPGDIVSLKNNKLVINGKAVTYHDEVNKQGVSILTELLSTNGHRIQVTENQAPYSSFPSVKVPENHYLVLGDNRDNSADSRVIGFVPRNEIIGRTNKVILSLDYENYFLPRLNRFFKDI